MAQWTDKYAIMRDLAMVQGFVPVDVQGTVVAGQKPPAPAVVEETEEEYFKDYVGGEEITAPDLGLIQQMLNMVRGIDVSSDVENEKKILPDCENSNSIIEIHKLKTLSPNSINNSQRNILNPKKPKKMKQRNAAVASLLQAAFENNQPTTNEPLKLLKPNDFESPSESVEKVNNWLDTQSKLNQQSPDSIPEQTALPKKEENTAMKPVIYPSLADSFVKREKARPVLEFDPALMFKKRTVESETVSGSEKDSSPEKFVTVSSSMFKRKTVSQKPLGEKPDILPAESCARYVPSSQADEYYKEYLKRSQIKKIVEKDIWAKVERDMKEIDAQRQLKEELAAKTSTSCTDTSGEVSPGDVTSSELTSDEVTSGDVTSAVTSAEGTSDEVKSVGGTSGEVVSVDVTSEEVPPVDVTSGEVTSDRATADYVESNEDMEYKTYKPDNQNLDAVRLPKHRHLLTGECVVCKVLSNVSINARESLKVNSVVETDVFVLANEE